MPLHCIEKSSQLEKINLIIALLVAHLQLSQSAKVLHIGTCKPNACTRPCLEIRKDKL